MLEFDGQHGCRLLDMVTQLRSLTSTQDEACPVRQKMLQSVSEAVMSVLSQERK